MMQVSDGLLGIFLSLMFATVGHGEANGVSGSFGLKRKRSESQMEVDSPNIVRPSKK